MCDIAARNLQRLEHLLALQPRASSARLRRPYDEASEGGRRPLVLFGCGALGRRTLAALKHAGKAPVALTDNNPAAWGREIDGVPVLSPADAVKAHGGDAVFAVSIYNGANARSQLQTLGCQRVIHFCALYQAFGEALMPHGGVAAPAVILSEAEAARAGARIWADDASQTEYVEQIAWRLGEGPGTLPTAHPVAERYFPPHLFELRDSDLFVDCGAFDGDSLRDLLKRQSNALGGFIGLEPDPQNFARLSAFIDTLPESVRDKVHAYPMAVASRGGSIRFCATASAGSTVAADGQIEVESVALDSLLGDRHPNFIKMDVEGNELDALTGSRAVIDRDRPILAICLYHKPEDLWQIPLFIRSVVPDYRLYLGRYAQDCWELVCYAVPESRLLA